MRAAKTTIVYIWFYFMLLFNWKLCTKPYTERSMFCYRFSPNKTSLLYITYGIQYFECKGKSSFYLMGYHIMFISNRKYGFTLRIALFPLQPYNMMSNDETSVIPSENITNISTNIHYHTNQIYANTSTTTAEQSMEILQLILNIISILWQTTQLRIYIHTFVYFFFYLFSHYYLYIYPSTNSSSPVVYLLPCSLLLFFYASNNKLKLIWL